MRSAAKKVLSTMLALSILLALALTGGPAREDDGDVFLRMGIDSSDSSAGPTYYFELSRDAVLTVSSAYRRSKELTRADNILETYRSVETRLSENELEDIIRLADAAFATERPERTYVMMHRAIFIVAYGGVVQEPDYIGIYYGGYNTETLWPLIYELMRLSPMGFGVRIYGGYFVPSGRESP
jgi:hypothetical protein